MLGTDSTAVATRGTGRVGLPARERAWAVVVAAVALVVMAWFGVHGQSWPDWQSEARPAVDSLMAGHVGLFLALAPAYGGSLLIRAPFMFAGHLLHAGPTALYTVGAAPCLAAAGALGAWLYARQRRRGASVLAASIALVLCAAGPLTLPALELGHPEEILGGVLCVVAVLCALDDRPVWAALALGLAMANKDWAVVAAGPVLLALPRARLRTLIGAAALAGAVVAPFLLAKSGGFTAHATAIGQSTGTIFQPWQLWWFLGAPAHGADAGRIAPGGVTGHAHELIIAIMPPLTALYAARFGTGVRPRHDVLLLLALLLALRCALDPWDISYYALPFLLTLLTWESLSYVRPPALTLAASLAAWFIFRETSATALDWSVDAQAAMFALVAVPAIIALAAAVYVPGARIPRPRPLQRHVAEGLTGHP